MNGSLRTFPRGAALAELGLFLVATLICYAASLSGPFLWDDRWLAVENPFIKSPLFVFEVFRHYLFLDSASAYYRPVQNLSYIFDYWAWGGEPFGFHFTNVLLHAAVGWLLFRLLKKLLGADAGWSPLAIAMVWVVHPIHNAAVAYVSGRADSLASLFAILAWLFYLKACQKTRAAMSYAGLAMVALLLALCSKEIALVWCALFLSFRFEGRKVPALLGVMLVIALYAALRFGLGDRPGLSSLEAPWNVRLLLMVRALGDYTWLMFFPDHLHMERMVYFNEAAGAWHQNIRLGYLAPIGLLCMVAFAWGALTQRPGLQWRRLGVLWFFMGFLPVSNLFPLNAQVAEHWIYMPSMGLLVFLAGCWRGWLPTSKTGAVLLGVAVVGLSVRTAIRSEDWADPERFFKQTIAAGGGTSRVWLNLAQFYAENGKLPEAAEVLSRMLEHFPGHLTAQINLGLVLIRQGKTSEGEKLLHSAVVAEDAKCFPQSWRASLKLAHQYSVRGQNEQAAKLLDAALVTAPNVWELTRLRASLCSLDAARALISQFVERQWWHYSAHIELGRLQLAHDQPEAAAQSWTKAAWLDLRADEPYRLLAQLRLQQNRPDLALAAQLRALKRNPHQPSQYLVLAKIYDQLGKSGMAAEAGARAQELRSSVPERFKHF